jgi:hypothetical protein
MKNMVLLLAALASLAALCAADAPAEAVKQAEPQVEIGTAEDARVQAVKSSIWIDAPPEKVWDCAIMQFDSWWPHCYKPDSHVVIEPWVGGRILEQFPAEGQGGLYGHVLYIDAPRVMKCDGQWGMGGAAVSGGLWRFEAEEGGTRFSSSGEVIARLTDPDQNLDARREAHADILLRLKRFVEDGVKVDRAAEAAAAAAQQEGH